jgi:hypothetical protein
MDENLTTIKWNIDKREDTYYEVHLYRYIGQKENRKLSTIKVVGRGNEIEKRKMTEDEVESLFFALEHIKIKFDDGNVLIHTDPYDDYRLRIKNSNFNLDFEWTSDGIYGNEALTISLNYVIEKLCDIKPFNLSELGLIPKE